MPTDREVAEAAVYVKDAVAELKDSGANHETVIEYLTQALEFLGANDDE